MTPTGFGQHSEAALLLERSFNWPEIGELRRETHSRTAAAQAG